MRLGWKLLAGYFDDSGTHAGSSVVVMGGLVGTTKQWDSLKKAWRTKLREPLPGKPSLKRFSTSQCRSHQGEFADYSQAESDAVTHDFRQIIIGVRLASTVSIVDRQAWDELVAGKARDVLGDAEQPCFVNCIDRACEWAAEQPGNSRIKLVFDQGRRTTVLEKIIELYKNNARFQSILSTIEFAEVAQTVPLQAADIVATESYWFAQEWLTQDGCAEGRAHFRDYKANMKCEGLIVGRSEIEAEIKRRGPDGLLLRD